MFYLYVIHFENFFYYVGKRKCPDKYNPWNDPYMGSPKTNKEKWKITKHFKTIIECFDNDKEVSEAETNLLLELDWENDPYCLNECCGGKFSYEANRRGALTKNQLPVKQTTREKMSKINLERWNNMEHNKKKKILKILNENKYKAAAASNTPEIIEKKKKIFKKIQHQQREKNSQYGKIWIHNIELKESKRINKEEPIPDGWYKGRIVDFDAYLKREQKKENKKIETKQKRENVRVEKIKYYTDWYKIYQQNSFKQFCEITGYSKSQQNLCAKFKEFVVDYNPKAKNK